MAASQTSALRSASGDAVSEVEEFLYMDPDTGMIVCMIADGDGFRPATAMQEMDALPTHWFGDHSLAGHSAALLETGDELTSLDAFVQNFEHAFLSPSAG